MQLGELALVVMRTQADSFHTASVLDYLAICYARSHHFKRAAEAFEEAASLYADPDDTILALRALCRATALSRLSGDDAAGQRCWLAAFERAIRNGLADSVGLLASITRWGDVMEFMRRGLEGLLALSEPPPLRALVFRLSALCERLENEDGGDHFSDFLRVISRGAMDGPAPSAANAAGLSLVCHSGLGIPAIDLNESIESSTRAYAFRSMPDGLRAWTVPLDLGQSIVQVVCLSDDPLAVRVSTALAIFLAFNQSQMEELSKTYPLRGGRGFTINVGLQSQWPIRAQDWPRDSEGGVLPCSTMSGPPPAEDTLLVLRDDFAALASWKTSPGNNVPIWVAGPVFQRIAQGLLEIDDEPPELTKAAMDFARAVTS